MEFEETVDVIREVMHEWAMLSQAKDTLIHNVGLANLVDGDKDVLKECDRRMSEAWARIRPALRNLVDEGAQSLTLNEYAERAGVLAVYPNRGSNPDYPALGICGESGEVADKIKKMHRDDGGQLTDERRQGLKKETGDVLWYVAAMAYELGFTLEEVAQANIEKLTKRNVEGTISGDGDDR